MNEPGLFSSDVLTALSAHPVTLCALIGLLAFAESLAFVGIFTPGIALLATVSAAAGAAAAPLSWLLAAGWIGAALGDGLSFMLGRHIGPGLRDPARYPRFAAWMGPGEGLVDRYGVFALLVGRFLGPVRPVLPLLAGVLRMRTPAFMTLNVLTAIAWSPAYILPGYLLGAAYGQRITVPSDWPWALLLALVIVGFAIRAGTRARRLGQSEGFVARRVRTWGGTGRWLGQRWPGTQDTRLTPLFAAGSSLLSILIPSVLAFASDTGRPWRTFVGELFAILRALW